nr:MAG TPA: hypothetical protein [Bacteriophage sp.]
MTELHQTILRLIGLQLTHLLCRLLGSLLQYRNQNPQVQKHTSLLDSSKGQ